MRKKNRFLFLALIWGLLLLSFLHWNNSKPEEGKTALGQLGKNRADLTVVDEMGRKISFPSSPRRIVVLTSYPAEIICALGEDERIVGMCNPLKENLPQLRQKESVGSSAVTPDLEKILQLRPDLVIAYQWTKKDIVEKLVNCQIPVLCFRAWTLDEVIFFLEQMGKLLGKEARVQDLKKYFQDKVSFIQEKTKNLPEEKKPLIFHEVFTPYQSIAQGRGIMETPWGNFSSTHAQQIQIELAGGKNCVGVQSTRSPILSGEWVLQKNPQIITKVLRNTEATAIPSRKVMQQAHQEIVQRTALKDVQAVREGQVYIIHSKLCAGPSLIVGLYYYAKVFQPELFEDLQPQVVEQELWQKLWGISAQGTWFYPEPEEKKKQALFITDSRGRKVEIAHPPQRIAAIGGSYGAETMLAFGAQNKIIAVADYAKKREDFKLFLQGIPDVGGSNHPNIEKILELQPDLVLAYAIYDYPEMEKVLKAKGIPLVQLDFFKPDKYIEEVRTLGKILGKEKRAEELIAFEKHYLDLIEQRLKKIQPQNKVRVYLESYHDYQTVSGKDERQDAITACGGINIFARASGTHPQVTSEAIIAENPDLMIKLFNGKTCLSGYGVTDPGELEKMRQKIMQRPGWQQIKAVNKERVYLLSSDTSSIHPSVFYTYLAKCFYPQYFTDFYPQKVYQKWTEKFLGMKLTGIYAYPEP